jgi:hypothetical protein
MVRNSIAACLAIVPSMAAAIVIAGCSVRVPSSALPEFRLSPPLEETDATALKTRTEPLRGTL